MKETSNSKKGGNLGQFILGKTIGEGTFGRVKIGTHINTGEKVAIKILEKIKILEEADKIRIDREIKILKSMMHKNIIQIYSVIENPTTIFLIMEYVNGGELFEYICLKQKLTELEACKFYQEIISGIEYLHKQGIVHRDLKPENLLLNAKKDLKIVDFGLSNIYRKGELLKTPCGSPCYAAPEMILGKLYNGLFVDIWSSGIILYAMVFGCLPFDDPNTDVLYKRITEGKFHLPSGASDRFKDFIKKVLTTDPNRRIGLEAIKSHAWFNLITPKLTQGIYIKRYQIPVDPLVLEEMQQMNYNKKEVRDLVMANRHNHTTTTYYLLLKKHIRNGKTSIADLASDEYIRYLNDPRNLLDNIVKNRISLDISKETVINNTTETVKVSKPTEETIINNNINSDSTASNNKLKESIVKETISNATNPDFHNIFDEQTNTNNNVLTSEAHKNSNKEIKTADSNKNNNLNHYQENLETEKNNNYFITDANVNYTETETQNNVLVTELNFTTKENNENNNQKSINYAEASASEANKNLERNQFVINNNLNKSNEEENKNDQNYNYNPAITEADNNAIPEYLHTDFNHDTEAKFNFLPTEYQATEQNENNNFNDDLNKKLAEDIRSNKNNASLSKLICSTENGQNQFKNNINKSEISDNSFVSNLYENIVMNTNIFNDNENLENKSLNALKNHNLNAVKNKQNANISVYKANLNKVNNTIMSRNNNIKKNILADSKSLNKSISKSPDVKKKVNFDPKNYMSKGRNKNENKINIIKNMNKTYRDNYLNTSYNDNVLNTESSVKKNEHKEKLNFSMRLNKNLINPKNNFYTNAKTTLTNNNQYLRNLVKTNAERYKKGFFNTSVSYEKSADIRNRTFDSKMYESSKSKSREKSPILNKFNVNILNQKNLLNNVKKDANKGILYKKINISKFQTNVATKNQSRNNSEKKRENLNDSSNKNELKSYNGSKKNEASNNVFNKNPNLYNFGNTYKYISQKSQKRDRHLNTSCPQNSDYTNKKTLNKDIYTIKEDDEYKKTAYLKNIKFPYNARKESNQNNSRGKNDKILNQTLNSSFNKSKKNPSNNSFGNKNPIENLNSTRINNKDNQINMIPNNIPKDKVNNFRNMNSLLTPPKYTNYANFKNAVANKNQTIKSNNNSNNTSLNNSITNNNANISNTPNKRGMVTLNRIRNKLLNVTAQKSIGKPKNSGMSDMSKPPNTTKKDINGYKIPNDKNSYKEKYKNININFYQNIIINENNNKRKASGNSDTNVKANDEKINSTGKLKNTSSNGFKNETLNEKKKFI